MHHTPVTPGVICAALAPSAFAFPLRQRLGTAEDIVRPLCNPRSVSRDCGVELLNQES